jgi:hypothetical protein
MRPVPVQYDGATFEFDGAGYRVLIDGAIYGAIHLARAKAALVVTDACQETSSRLVAVIGDRLILSTGSRGVAKTQTVSKLEETVSLSFGAVFPGLTPRINVTVQEHL